MKSFQRWIIQKFLSDVGNNSNVPNGSASVIHKTENNLKRFHPSGQTEMFMVKAFRDEAVVHLPRVSNNAAHGHLNLVQDPGSLETFSNIFIEWHLN